MLIDHLNSLHLILPLLSNWLADKQFRGVTQICQSIKIRWSLDFSALLWIRSVSWNDTFNKSDVFQKPSFKSPVLSSLQPSLASVGRIRNDGSAPSGPRTSSLLPFSLCSSSLHSSPKAVWLHVLSVQTYLSDPLCTVVSVLTSSGGLCEVRQCFLFPPDVFQIRSELVGVAAGVRNMSAGSVAPELMMSAGKGGRDCAECVWVGFQSWDVLKGLSSFDERACCLGRLHVLPNFFWTDNLVCQTGPADQQGALCQVVFSIMWSLVWCFQFLLALSDLPPSHFSPSG